MKLSFLFLFIATQVMAGLTANEAYEKTELAKKQSFSHKVIDMRNEFEKRIENAANAGNCEFSIITQTTEDNLNLGSEEEIKIAKLLKSEFEKRGYRFEIQLFPIEPRPLAPIGVETQQANISVDWCKH